MVIAAFATLYLVWGSTYFFIREALDGFPPMLLGGLRFMTAALLMLGWCALRGLPVRPGRDLGKAAIVGFLLLFIGNGVVVWVEQVVPSSLVAIMIAAAPLWFVVLDRPLWPVNLRSRSTVLGVLTGFGGVLLLFGGRNGGPSLTGLWTPEVTGLGLLVISTMAWTAGSLYAKRSPLSLPAAVGISWQMLTAGACFLLAATFRGEWAVIRWAAVPANAWFAMVYLVLFGSLAGFSAYVWLLARRPATQVSTYAYVNPVVAVLLGVLVGQERIGTREVAGLAVVLGGVLLINLAKYRKAGRGA